MGILNNRFSDSSQLDYNKEMKAEIIAIGTELLLGEIADTNSSYIAAELPRLGIDLYWISSVGDNRERLLEVLSRAWNRSDLIFTTGGLGPSEGDITRSTIALLAGEQLTLDPGVIERLKARFARSGREMTQSNIKQAGIIPSATFIPNSRGTAPGWWLEKAGRIFIAMPGPPAEMHAMWQNGVLPRLKEIHTGSVLISRTVKLWGISESAINDMFLPLFSAANPTVAIYAKADGIYIRIAAKADTEDKAMAMIAPVEARVRTALGDAVWGSDSDTMEAVAARLFAEKKLSLAVIEGYTGGQLIDTIGDSPAMSSFFRGGVVASDSDTLQAIGINVSLYENPEALADAIRLKIPADIGLGVTDFPPQNKKSGETAGTVFVGIAYKDTKKSVPLSSVRERARAKGWVVSAALFELIKFLRASNI
jgi:nicotinamide-nucleotide amidase